MQETLLILSKSEKCLNNEYIFHFKGFYKGIKIKSLIIKTSEKINLDLGRNYLLWGRKTDLIDGVLKLQLIKYKKI
jgi:hypothetical protein